MEFLELANLLIPGYVLLTQNQRSEFESSEEIGEHFKNIIKWSIAENTNKKDLENCFREKKEQFANLYSEHECFINLKNEISRCVIKKEHPYFSLLTESEQLQLAKTSYSHNFTDSILIIDDFIAKEQKKKRSNSMISMKIDDAMLTFHSHKTSEIHTWQARLSQDPAMSDASAKINNQLIARKTESHSTILAACKERARKLAIFFPILNYRKSEHTDLTFLEELEASYLTPNGELKSDLKIVEEVFLTKLLFDLIKHETDQLNGIDDFNLHCAKLLANNILNAFHEQKLFTINKWISSYNEALQKLIFHRIQLINNQVWIKSEIGEVEKLINSVSYLFWNNKAVGRTTNFLGKLSDAHAFIQATSFSTQNENSFLAILDLYNYGRYTDQIAETKSIIASLMSPFTALYEEYRNIAFYENNLYLKTIRSLIPMLIVVGFIIAVAAALTPLGIPELAFAAAFIPAFFIGLGLATKYVTFKNSIHKSFHEWRYGGKFEIPEFQVSERMIRILTSEMAIKVRKFYIDSINYCDEQETSYFEKYKNGILLCEDIKDRHDNTKLRHQLALEWYDIHSNPQLGLEEIPLIIRRRLKQQCDTEFTTLKKTEEEEHNQIAENLTLFSTNIITALSVPAPLVIENVISRPTLQPLQRYGLFPARCLAYKARVEDLATLDQEIVNLRLAPAS